jgi:hypothetical protein
MPGRENKISKGTFAERTEGLPGRRVGCKQTKTLGPEIADGCYRKRHISYKSQVTSQDTSYVKYVPIVNAFKAVIMT